MAKNRSNTMATALTAAGVHPVQAAPVAPAAPQITGKKALDPLESIRLRAAQIVSKPRAGKKGKSPKTCACGCSEMTKGGNWMPGHDGRVLSLEVAKLRAAEATAAKEVEQVA